MRDPELEDQVTAVYAVAQEFNERGFGAQLLAAVFRFEGGEHPVYWIYGFKTGTFWPFVPTGREAGARQRARAGAEGEARAGAAGREGPLQMARLVRRADLAARLSLAAVVWRLQPD